MTIIRTATLEDAQSLAKNLCESDRAELYAAGHDDVEEILAESVELSDEAMAVVDEEGVAALFGFALQGFMGIPWLLCSDRLRKEHRRLLLTAPRHYLSKWSEQCSFMGNLVHAENKASIRWLKHLGFTIHPATEVRRGQFHPFTMGKQTNV